MGELTGAAAPTTLRLREQGTTWYVRIHRPEADNALNETLVRELTEVLTRASRSSATVVVLEGLPEVFCFGADFGAIGEAVREGGRTAADPEPLFDLFRLLAYGDFVSVAHVRGKANAGGVGLVAASDVVIADESATFSLSELLFGLIPAVVLPFLIRRTGFQHAHYLAATTRTADAARACEWGLVDVYGPDSEALLRTHLQRLGRLSKKAVTRYKAYLRELSPVTEHAKSAALATNRLVFEDPENVRAIQRYAEEGVFPWENTPADPRETTPQPAETLRPTEAPVQFTVPPEALGSARFREAHGVRYAYAAGAMYKGIASVELVTAMGRSGLLSFFGTGGLGLEAIDDALTRIRRALDQGQAFGVNLLSNPQEPDLEMRTVELYLRHGVRTVEASAYIRPTPALVRYRLAGLSRDAAGNVVQNHHIVAKASRAEVAERFLRPAPPELVRELVERGLVTPEQAELGARLPLAQDLCVEADSAGHTDGGNAYVLMPAMRVLRDRVGEEERYPEPVRLGAAGGIGTPQAALAAFTLGADFIVTGSINQCTVEAGTSDAVKDILQELGVHDTDYAPAGDMFEVGAKVQAVRKGLFFPARAQKLYELYLRHDSLDDLDERTRATLEEKFFRRSIDEVWAETRAHVARRFPQRLAEIERSPKKKMALVFRWYFVHSTRLAMAGSAEQRVDYQIHCGPAMGAFNAWVRDTPLEKWRERRVAAVAEHLLRETAALLGKQLGTYGSYA
ncbi:enoyl-CoA hydratase/isomerase [Streptomyces sp. CBMA152]|uniref:enoyl-CoA hydratase/isomerase n=1 Tax=Streptomyces sp. CBMA152 TaxID=1896312 RepID=UPI0016615546|nr:enoyl-CoA hydratase/isomerase [Streptomyces sp. CBMA152]MBD0742352.1 polyketide biosynthesis protein PksE [Streptomyces sp. CBMA152]